MRQEITYILMSSDGLSAKCPVCGVWSNLFPDYNSGENTAVIHALTYCGHIVGQRFQKLVEKE